MSLDHDKVEHRLSLLGLAALVAMSPSSAWAYVDPGSGSLLLQIAMSAFLGAVFLGRSLIAKTLATARRWFGGRPETPLPTAPPDEPVS